MAISKPSGPHSPWTHAIPLACNICHWLDHKSHTAKNLLHLIDLIFTVRLKRFIPNSVPISFSGIPCPKGQGIPKENARVIQCRGTFPRLPQPGGGELRPVAFVQKALGGYAPTSLLSTKPPWSRGERRMVRAGLWENNQTRTIMQKGFSCLPWWAGAENNIRSMIDSYMCLYKELKNVIKNAFDLSYAIKEILSEHLSAIFLILILSPL